MDLSLVKLAWQCVSEHFPQLAGAALQVIGGATILFRLLGSQMVSGNVPPASSGLIGKLTSLLSSIALNKG